MASMKCLNCGKRGHIWNRQVLFGTWNPIYEGTIYEGTMDRHLIGFVCSEPCCKSCLGSWHDRISLKQAA